MQKKSLPPKVHRVVFNEITKSAVQNAIKNPREVNLDLVKAQRLRQDIFLQLKKEKIALHHNDICQRKNTVLGEYTKDVAKTKLKEINHFIKKNDLKINFMLKKASI